MACIGQNAYCRLVCQRAVNLPCSITVRVSPCPLRTMTCQYLDTVVFFKTLTVYTKYKWVDAPCISFRNFDLLWLIIKIRVSFACLGVVHFHESGCQYFSPQINVGLGSGTSSLSCARLDLYWELMKAGQVGSVLCICRST